MENKGQITPTRYRQNLGCGRNGKKPSVQASDEHRAARGRFYLFFFG
jgi:hypothetical protein